MFGWRRSLSYFVILLVIAMTIFLGNAILRKNSFPKIETQDESRLEVSATSVVASGLEIPWGLAFSPDGNLLFTERPGRLRKVDGGIFNLLEVKHIGEGGLLGIALHPDFKNNKYIYLYYTYSGVGNNTLNRVVRFKFGDDTIDEQIIIDAIPGGINHNGGRIRFGPDNFLYITTGDAQNPSLAQDKNSLAGKILRVTDEGKPAPGNSFNNLVYSYGHRNPQGLVWDDQGRLWATEHGRSGIQSGLDELNLIEKGQNYGWPIIQGDEEREGMVSPVIHSGPKATWAPAGAAFFKGSIFFGGLRGEGLFEYQITDKTLQKHFEGKFGRIREVVLGPDGFLYITTSNRDGRGTPKEGDDKIIKIDPQKL